MDDKLTLNELKALSVIQFKERYGLEIIKTIKEEANTTLHLGTLYNLLARLEKRNFVSSRSGDQTEKRGVNRRRYYRLKGPGEKALNSAKRSLLRLWKEKEPLSCKSDDQPVIDYDALAMKSEGIDANKDPDGVISLLEPYKDDNSNNNGDFYNNLALAYDKKGRIEEAIDLYKRSLRLNPNDPVIQYNLGITYYNHGNLREALEHISISVGLRPNHESSEKMKKLLSDKAELSGPPEADPLQ